MPETTVGQHTPGPWRIMPPMGPGDMAVQSERVNAGGNFYVAVLPNSPHAESDANARLIAAAPELLQACQDLVGTAHVTTARCGFGRKFTPKNNPCDCSQHAAYDAARAAITKATGGAL